MRRALLPLLMLLACTPSRVASRSDCEAIVARIVEIELEERGFRDPRLERRTRERMIRRYADELDVCVGNPLTVDALSCIAEAETTEALSHDCLRTR